VTALEGITTIQGESIIALEAKTVNISSLGTTTNFIGDINIGGSSASSSVYLSNHFGNSYISNFYNKLKCNYDLEVNGNLIFNGNITTGNITTGNITTGNITTGNITTGNITTGNITTANISNANITNSTQTPTINTTNIKPIYNNLFMPNFINIGDGYATIVINGPVQFLNSSTSTSQGFSLSEYINQLNF